MAIDYWGLTRDYKNGDAVQRFMPGDPGNLSPFVGMVTAVHRGLGMIDVQWPTGNERISSDELVKVNPSLMRYLPPTLDQSYLSYDIQKARQASSSQKLWRTIELPQGFHRDLARLWLRQANEVAAYDALWRTHVAQGASDAAVRDEIAKFYLISKNLGALRIQQHLKKTAAYWVAQNRQYRMTGEELQVRCPNCPKCGTRMVRTTYRMQEGTKHKLFACPKDLFLIEDTSLIGPGGEPVVW